jgi:apolipoprotein N-acyltransferase
MADEHVADEPTEKPDDEPTEKPDDAPASEPESAAAPEAPGRSVQFGDTLRRAVTTAGAAVVTRLPAVWAALLPRLVRLSVTVVAGVLLFASFPTVNWWWAAFIAFALLAWVLTNAATTPAGGLGYGFLFGLAFYLPLLPWIGLLVGPVPWIALATICALFPAVFGLFAVVVRRLPGWPVWVALLWTSQEFLKSAFPFGGFPWGAVAFGQTRGPLLPLVQLGGVALLSAAVVLVGCSATAIAVEIAAWLPLSGQRVDRGQATAAAARPPAVVWPGVYVCVVFLAAVLVWPQVRHAGTGSGGEPPVSVAVVQGNVPRLGFDFNSQRRAVLDNHVRQTLQLAEDVRAGVAVQPLFVIWPEDSSDIDPLLNPDAGRQISRAAAAIHAPILVGTVLDVPAPASQNPEYTNTVIVWDPVAGPSDRHDKEIVQPFGEYLPMPWLFRHLSGFADRAGHFVPRSGSGLVHIAGVPVGVSTCWEVIFDREPREAVRNGAQLLAVPSNNATFNQTMSEQQLAFAKVRAVEHDRYVVVAGTTGISAVIAPDGSELARTEFFQPAYLDNQVRLKTGLTPATQWAPILQWVAAVAAIAAILAGIRQNGWFPRPTRPRFRHPGESDDSGAPPGESEGSDELGHAEAGAVPDEDAPQASATSVENEHHTESEDEVSTDTVSGDNEELNDHRPA